MKRADERKYPRSTRPERLCHRLKAELRGGRGEVPFGAAALNRPWEKGPALGADGEGPVTGRNEGGLPLLFSQGRTPR